ncbi:MAG: PilZ domain-containing protein [Sedimentisphaerales bacterium]|nr:PilZ domain-containing protein [Sedimentisphaerales bacterium]
MTMTIERRNETRLRYNWPIWFAENFYEMLTQGQMADISSGGASFTCYADKCPYPGQSLTARFSVPRYGDGESFNMYNFIRSGHVSRVEEISLYVRRVAVQFAQPLPFKPGQQDDPQKETMEALAGVTA